MEKETIAVISALAGATVATAAALVTRHLEKAKDNQTHAAEMIQAQRDAKAQGWLEGRNRKLQEETGEREVFSNTRTA